MYHPEAGYKNATGGILTSTLFTVTGETNQSGFDEDGNGNLRRYHWVDNQKLYVDNTAGTINYDTGVVNISSAIFPQTGVYFTVIPDGFDMVSQNNIILRIATDSSLVEAIEQNEKATIKSNNVSRSA